MNRLLLLLAIAAFSVVSTVQAQEQKMAQEPKMMHEQAMMHEPVMMMDANKDGMVSKAEFMKYEEDMFAQHDKDGKGMMSKDQIMMMMHMQCPAMMKGMPMKGMMEHREMMKDPGMMPEKGMMPDKDMSKGKM
jgi:hypothetical protein